jgi:hypothetical protein
MPKKANKLLAIDDSICWRWFDGSLFPCPSLMTRCERMTELSL